MTDFTREVRFEPGYDHRAEDATKPWGTRRGCHGMNIRWLLHGPAGTIQFLIYSSWLPSWVGDSTFGKTITVPPGEPVHPPMGADLGHHWDEATYEGEKGFDKCDVRPAGRCFNDGSGLRADDLLGVLLTEGHEAVWSAMEDDYRHYENRDAQEAS